MWPRKNVDVILPGFTHLQVAQPVSFATTCWPMWRCSRATPSAWRDVRRRVNRLPLGSAALAGTTYPLDRERVARTLGMVDGRPARSLPEQPGRRERPRLRH
jgi:argininosuccinate lyase